MKLRDKKTGKIVTVESLTINHNGKIMLTYLDNGLREMELYNSFAALHAQWEDSAPEETKVSWHISCRGEIIMNLDLDNQFETDKKLIGNRFKTKGEAERAVEKLKAWKRLRDKGIELYGWGRAHTGTYEFLARWEGTPPREADIMKDLNLLFGGGE